MDMNLQIVSFYCRIGTHLTFIWLVFRVPNHVLIQCRSLDSLILALIAFVRFVPRMGVDVSIDSKINYNQSSSQEDIPNNTIRPIGIIGTSLPFAEIHGFVIN